MHRQALSYAMNLLDYCLDTNFPLADRERAARSAVAITLSALANVTQQVGLTNLTTALESFNVDV